MHGLELYTKTRINLYVHSVYCIYLWYNHIKNMIFVWFQSKHIDSIKTSVLYVNNQPNLITLDYTMDVHEILPEEQLR